MITTTPDLRALLRDCQVQANFEDVNGRRRRASTDSQLALLRSLGIDIERPRQAADILQERKQQRARRGIEPVTVAWIGCPASVGLTFPEDTRLPTVHYELNVEGDRIERSHRLDKLASPGERDHVSPGFRTYRLPLPSRLPLGYHRLRVEANGQTFESLVISAPRKAYIHDEPAAGDAARIEGSSNGHAAGNGIVSCGRPSATKQARREWGGFSPLYALRSRSDWGAGDFGLLRELAEWVAGLGGSTVGTLPLFAAFLDEPYEASPYRPATRLFWNEFYIDVEAVPELRDCQPCRELITSGAFRGQIESQHARDFVDYREVMQLKRRALALLAAEFFTVRPPRFAEFQRFIAENPLVEDYARFRATVEKRRAAWPAWPSRMRDGALHEGDYDQPSVEYYLYTQWIAFEQLKSLKQHPACENCGLYLDLPVGVDPASYDVWRHQPLYVMGAMVGSPPDPVYTKGQEWGLPPLHPERIRDDGYHLFRRVMEANMTFARYLRIDHVMGLERLYCIPNGFSPNNGIYLRYNAEEMFAVVVIESHRHQCAVIGENLGRVPREVERRMNRHGIGGMWVAPYELEPGRRAVLSPPPSGSLASLNTHDMAPFAAWRRAAEVADREALGLIDAPTAQRERDERREQVKQLIGWLKSVGALQEDLADDVEGREETLLAALLRSIAASPAALVLVNLEDLWFETRPQNFPGTTDERPNWTRKAQLTLDEFRRMPKVRELLEELNTVRKGRPKPR